MTNRHLIVRWTLAVAWLTAPVALGAAGCDCGDDPGGADTGMADTGPSDGAMPDATDPDAGEPDAGTPDAGDGSTGDGSLPDAGPLDGGPVFACDRVEPTVASTLVDTTLTLTGVVFAAAATAELRNVSTGAVVALGPVTPAPDGRSATVGIPAGAAPQGLYQVVLLNMPGEEAICGDVRISALAPPTITDVIPPNAWRGVAGDGVLSDETVTVIGTNFRITPSIVFVKRDDPARRYEAITVNWISATQLSAVVPSETSSMPLGTYDVFAVNPDGLSGRWNLADGITAGDFIITGTPPPRITGIDPLRSPAASDVAMTITGESFQPGAQVTFEGVPAFDPAEMNDPTSPSTRLMLVVPGGTLTLGFYPVRVTNPDGQFDVYYGYSATASSSGHLGPFEPSGVTLIEARWRHATEYGFDPFARSYLYVSGGIDATGGVLGNVEVIEVGPTGALSPSRIDAQWESATAPRVRNLLTTPRSAHTLLRMGRWLYAVGGADTNSLQPAAVPALDTIDRAKILDYTEMPAMRRPRLITGEGLPAGTWYYQASALGPWGESLASREVQLLRASGQVEICWAAVAGATGYNLYRSPASDGRAGTTRALVAEIPAASTCVTDTGRDEMQPAPGRVRGTPSPGPGLAAGTWTYRVTAVVGTRETVAGYRTDVTITDAAANGQVTLEWDPVVGATYNVYRSTVPSATTRGDEATFLVAAGVTTTQLVDDGAVPDTARPAPDGVAPLPPGTLSRWTELTRTLTMPREGLDGVIVTVPSGNDTAPDRTIMYLVGGHTGMLMDHQRTAEWAVLDSATGDFATDFTLDAALLNVARAYYPLLTNVGQRETPLPPPPDEPPCIDFDGDGFLPPECGGPDCNDLDPTIHPGAPDPCGDGIDMDCDGIDPMCMCMDDVDGDMHVSIPCGGDDCNDMDRTIHPGAMEICGDGIDQDCNGVDVGCPMCTPEVPTESCELTPALCDDGRDQDCDTLDCTCFIIFSGELPDGWGSAARSAFARTTIFADALPWWELPPFQTPPGLDATIAAGPIYLIAVAGDDVFTDPNTGLTTFEVSAISTAPDPTNGSLLGWTLQTNTLPMGRRTHGLDAVLYFDYMFAFGGVQTERRAGTISPMASATSRFPYAEMPAAPNRVIDRFESSSATFTISRAYYSVTRLSSRLFLIGGHDGTGPEAVIESVPQ